MIVKFHLVNHFSLYFYFVKDGHLDEYINSYNRLNDTKISNHLCPSRVTKKIFLVIEQSEEKTLGDKKVVFYRLFNGHEIFWGESDLFIPV